MFSLASKYGQPPRFLTTAPGDRHKLPVDDKALQGKKIMADGVFKSLQLNNNMHGLCSVYNAQEDFHLYKIPLNTEFFVLRIDEISPRGNLSLKAEGSYSHEVAANRQSVLLMSSLEEFTFFAPGNSEIKTLEILMPRIWFFSQLNMECSYGMLKKYMHIKTLKSMTDCSNDLFENLFLTIVREVSKKVYDFDYVLEKISSLLNLFFTDITASLREFREFEKIKISRDEINRLMNVRKYLDTNLPSPTFTSLTKIALMSGTSLKTKFKKMYGATVFEYYQRKRMERARILLLTHKYSVKQIGRELGYSNLSNFTIAFKKEFNRLPHELTK